MRYSLAKLPNGLRVLTVPMPSLASATVTIWVKTGSWKETNKIAGLSHFLEHMVFKGSSKRPSAKEIAEEVDAIGAEFNAGTSKDWTNFYIKARSGKLEMAFDVLSDMVLNPLLKTEDIEKEKGVIVEEIRMYEDTPLIRIGDVFEQLIFSGSVLGRDISGSEATVKALTRDDFVRYRNTHYYTDNILITVSGGLEESRVLALGQKYFKSLSGTKSRGKEPKIQISQNKPRVKLHAKKKEQAHFIFGYLAEGRGYKGRFAQAVLGAILGGGMSSRLFTEVREKRGLAYSVRTLVERYQQVGYVGTYAGVDVKRVDEAIKVVLDEHQKLASGKNPISRVELRKAKEYLKGHLALALEDTRDVNAFFAENQLFLNKIETPEEVFRAIDAVSIENVLSEAKKLFRPERLNLAIIGPYKEESRFRKLLA
jgi:predicted Zn-dependent peptidase